MSSEYYPVLTLGDLALTVSNDGSLLYRYSDNDWLEADDAFEQNLPDLLSEGQLKQLFQAQSDVLTERQLWCVCCRNHKESQ